MSEIDVLLVASLEEAVAKIDSVAAELGATFVLTEAGMDFRSGHVELRGDAVLNVIVMLEEPRRAVVRVDTKTSLGEQIAKLLEARPAPE